MAALAGGESEIGNVELSEDIRASLRCVQAMGARVNFVDGVLTVHGVQTENLKITGVPDCGECGTTLRFMAPVCLLSAAPAVLTGSPRLLARPLSVYEALCRERGLSFANTGTELRLQGRLKSGSFTVPGNVSSQFISGLLLILPLLPGNSTIHITGQVESRPYIDLTLQAQRTFGVETRWQDERSLFIPGGARYTPCGTEAEGDWSNAAFFYALQYLGCPVSVRGTDPASLQGDRICLSYFAALKKGFAELDLSDCPDLAPVMFAFAAMNHGGRFTGTARLRIKESDRAAAMAQELKKCGCDVRVCENEAVVPGGALHAPEAPFNGHNDHRIVMSLSLLCLRFGGTIGGAGAVNKSYPGYFEDLKKLGAELYYEAE